MEAGGNHGIKEGWLIKVGSFKTNWRRRYFILQGGPLLGRLDYYKKETKTWKGAITLSKVEEAKFLDSIDDLNRLVEQISRNTSDAVLIIPKIKDLPKEHHFFAIKTSRRLWILGAKTPEERSQWVTAINDVAKRVNSPENSDGICPTPPRPAQTWSMGSVKKARCSQVLQAAPSAGIWRKSFSANAASSAAAGTVSDYMRTDPEGDKARLAALCAVFKEFVTREKALKRESACNVVPLGRLCSLDPGRPDALEKSVMASRVYGAWGEQLYAYAQRLIEARCDTLSESGLPVVTFLDHVKKESASAKTEDEQADDDDKDEAGKEVPEKAECYRDVRYVLIVLSEAFEKIVSACDRKNWTAENKDDELISLERAAELCGNILTTSVAFLRTLTDASVAESLAMGTHARLGEESPLRGLTPDLTKLIAKWAIPGLVAPGDKKTVAIVAERSALAQLCAEHAFMSKHIKRILSAGPIRFGFLNIRFPVEDANNFAKITGKVPESAYDGELPEGRLYCELSDEALCFTTSAKGDEVVIPLLWIRKLEVESSGGCFMKFTRYLDEPSAESNMETRIIYGDNTVETFSWLTDITRMFLLRRQEK